VTLNELRDEAYKTAKEKGWHDSPRSPLEIHMLIVSEVAEATEQVRIGRPHFYAEVYVDANREKAISKSFLTGAKPEGEAVELADAVIRIANYFGEKGWDLEGIVRAKMDYNKTRSYRHGNKSI
jgi:hypothetical protein